MSAKFDSFIMKRLTIIRVIIRVMSAQIRIR